MIQGELDMTHIMSVAIDVAATVGITDDIQCYGSYVRTDQSTFADAVALAHRSRTRSLSWKPKPKKRTTTRSTTTLPETVFNSGLEP